MYEISGELHVKGSTQQITEKFKKREFVIKTTNQYEPYIKFELKQDGVDAIEDFNIGDNIKVGFFVGGREWVKNGITNYFTSLTANTIEKFTQENAQVKFDDVTQNTGGVQVTKPVANTEQQYASDLPF